MQDKGTNLEPREAGTRDRNTQDSLCCLSPLAPASLSPADIPSSSVCGMKPGCHHAQASHFPWKAWLLLCLLLTYFFKNQVKKKKLGKVCLVRYESCIDAAQSLVARVSEPPMPENRVFEVWHVLCKSWGPSQSYPFCWSALNLHCPSRTHSHALQLSP